MPHCIQDSIPKFGPCPAPPSYDCSSGQLEWTHEDEWVIDTGRRISGYHVIVPSSPDEPGSYKVEMLVETDATCGGRSIVPIDGWFDTERAEGACSQQGDDTECYRVYYCDWQIQWLTQISGSEWDTYNIGGEEFTTLGHTVIRNPRRCVVGQAATTAPIQNHAFFPSTEYDCDPAFMGE